MPKKNKQNNLFYYIIHYMNKNTENTPKRSGTLKKSNSLVTKIALRATTIICIGLLVTLAGYFGLKSFRKPVQENKYALIDKQLSYCQELVTLKYRYSDISTIKKSSGFARSYSLVKYSGIIRAGIADVTHIKYDVSIDGKKIVLTIPDAEILGNEIVKQEVFDESSSIFVPITTKEVFDEIQRSQDETCQDLIAEGLLDEARAYAINILTQFMHSIGFEEVIIK